MCLSNYTRYEKTQSSREVITGMFGGKRFVGQKLIKLTKSIPV